MVFCWVEGENMLDLVPLFLDLISFDTMSDEVSTTYPSSEKESEFADKLVEILHSIGVSNAYKDEYSLVYAHVDNNKEKTIGLIAHMDTSPALKGGIKNPRIIKNYDGKDIKLNDKYLMEVNEFPFLKEIQGDDIIATDGEHLLGGDDKAGITIILTFVNYYINHKDEFNYNLAISFTPDEEIGKGALHFDVKKMKADVAYTLDGGSIFEASYENFNAAHANLKIYGVGVHPGSAKDIMVNAAMLASEYVLLLPSEMVPEKTENREGFIHLTDIKGDVEEASLSFILRDHDKDLLEEKKIIKKKALETLKNKYPHGKFELTIEDDYRNMFDYFKNDMTAINLINKAYLNSNVKLTYSPIRGGTDGATITYLGLPCPNLGVGDFSPHGRFEVVSINQMEKMVEILKELFK